MSNLPRYFNYDHLPPFLQEASRPFWVLAKRVCDMLPESAERTVCLRKLLEAKDCAVRAMLDKMEQAALMEAADGDKA